MIKIINFSFKKISSERISESIKDIKINTKIDISSIEEIKSEFLGENEKILKLRFVYNIDYTPEIAKINLEGNVLLSLGKEEADTILKSWKNKKISEAFKISIFNLILRKSNVKALALEEEMNLPFHIPFPTLKSKK
jgi:hypothetical protein